MPLPNVELLNNIFDIYLTSLKHQSNIKKNGAFFLNKFRAWIGTHQHNDYIQNDMEEIKKSKILSFKNDFQQATLLPFEDAVKFWVSTLDNLDEELSRVKQAEIIHESKYGLALRTISTVICNALKQEEIFKAIVKQRFNRLEAADQLITQIKTAGFKPPESLLDKDTNRLLRLVRLNDLDATLRAAHQGLLNGFSKPEEKQFSELTPFNRLISHKAAIHPLLPWAYQPEDPIPLYTFRMTHHRWPNTKEEFRQWKITNPEIETLDETKKLKGI